MALETLVRTISALLLLAIVVGSILTYAALPEQFATRFDFAGRPDGWASRSPLGWFALPGVAVLAYALLEWSGWYVRRHPLRTNLPDRRKLEQLTESGREKIAGYASAFVHATNLAMMTLFAALFWGLYAIAQGAPRLPMVVLVVLYVVVFGSIVSGPFLLWFISSRTDKLYRSARDADVITP